MSQNGTRIWLALNLHPRSCNFLRQQHGPWAFTPLVFFHFIHGTVGQKICNVDHQIPKQMPKTQRKVISKDLTLGFAFAFILAFPFPLPFAAGSSPLGLAAATPPAATAVPVTAAAAAFGSSLQGEKECVVSGKLICQSMYCFLYIVLFEFEYQQIMCLIYIIYMCVYICVFLVPSLPSSLSTSKLYLFRLKIGEKNPGLRKPRSWITKLGPINGAGRAMLLANKQYSNGVIAVNIEKNG